MRLLQCMDTVSSQEDSYIYQLIWLVVFNVFFLNGNDISWDQIVRRFERQSNHWRDWTIQWSAISLIVCFHHLSNIFSLYLIFLPFIFITPISVSKCSEKRVSKNKELHDKCVTMQETIDKHSLWQYQRMFEGINMEWVNEILFHYRIFIYFSQNSWKRRFVMSRRKWGIFQKKNGRKWRRKNCW